MNLSVANKKTPKLRTVRISPLRKTTLNKISDRSVTCEAILKLGAEPRNKVTGKIAPTLAPAQNATHTTHIFGRNTLYGIFIAIFSECCKFSKSKPATPNKTAPLT